VLETGVVPLAPELGEWLEAREEQMVENVSDPVCDFHPCQG